MQHIRHASSEALYIITTQRPTLREVLGSPRHRWKNKRGHALFLKFPQKWHLSEHLINYSMSHSHTHSHRKTKSAVTLYAQKKERKCWVQNTNDHRLQVNWITPSSVSLLPASPPPINPLHWPLLNTHMIISNILSLWSKMFKGISITWNEATLVWHVESNLI